MSDRAKVETFLNTYFKIIGTYTISDEGVIDVDGEVNLDYNKFNKDGFTELPIQFGHVTEAFYFEYSNIKTLKGFPHTVDNLYIRNSKELKSLEFSPKCQGINCVNCHKLESLDFLNSKYFYAHELNLKKIGNVLYLKHLDFPNIPSPTADEMRKFITLNISFFTPQKTPWITLINDYWNHQDIFKAITEFEELYNEPWAKPENRIKIIQSNNEELSF